MAINKFVVLTIQKVGNDWGEPTTKLQMSQLGLENYRSFERNLETLYLELTKGNPNDENT